MRISHKEKQCIFTQPGLEESNNCPNTQARFSRTADDLFQETPLTKMLGMSPQAKMRAEIGLNHPPPLCPPAVLLFGGEGAAAGPGWVRCQPGRPRLAGCGPAEHHRHLRRGESDPLSQRWHPTHTQLSAPSESFAFSMAPQ